MIYEIAKWQADNKQPDVTDELSAHKWAGHLIGHLREVEKNGKGGAELTAAELLSHLRKTCPALFSEIAILDKLRCVQRLRK